ncbi:cell division cycle 7-related protein kinase [Anopheles moucheti]|uniref:cell division cycle 7-related protein kinase n=1 Tax=Anopheles moucheti TaxID=186751 RepID=UPI0022EFE640|nr:cell division cycle 7-related protein kinase [Anopheles moucheti]
MDSAQQQRQSLRSDCDEEEEAARDVKMQPVDRPDLKVAQTPATPMVIEQETAVIRPKMEAASNNAEPQNTKFWDRYEMHGEFDKGTFSTVLLASLRAQQHLPLDKRSKFAIKLIVPTSHPDRIAREILCMKKMGGQCNVIGYVDAFRFKGSGSVGVVMHYIPQEPFHLYFAQLTPADVQRYLQQLLIALKRVHLFGVIHRDVKPSNFLHSPRHRTYMLVDFGLAQETNKGVLSLRTPGNQPAQTDEGVKREDQVVPQHQDTVLVRNPLNRKTNSNTHPLKLSNSTTKDLADVPMLGRQIKSVASTVSNGVKHRRSAMLENRSPYARDLKTDGANVASRQSRDQPTCMCPGQPQVCNLCLVKPEMNAPRAGTPGYRPPEVLLKYPDQTTAVDIWAAGVIFLSLLSKLYPVFTNEDDLTSLAQIIEVFGYERIKETARVLKQRLGCSPETMAKQPYNLRRFCQNFRLIYKRRESGTAAGGSSPPSGRDEENLTCDNCCKPPDSCLCQRRRIVADESVGRPRDADCDEYGPEAYDLLERLLETNPHQRITASEALQHPYFNVQY